MIARFKSAFGRALPELPKRELSWRLHFIMGALSYTLAGTDVLKLIEELRPDEHTDDERLLQRLAPFLLAGLTAPLGDLPDAPDAATAPSRSRVMAPAPSSPTIRNSTVNNGPSARSKSMLTVLWLVAVLAGAVALAYVNASASSGPPPSRSRLGAAWGAHLLVPWLTLVLTRRVRPARDRAQHRVAAAQADQRRRALRVPQGAAADVADRARSDRGRHGLVGRRALLRQARLAQAARRAAPDAHTPKSRASSTTRPRSCAG